MAVMGPGAVRPPVAVRRDGYWLVRDARDTRADARGDDGLAERYLAAAERDRYAQVAAPRARRDWLLGRVAAKDAVRAWLGERGRAVPDPTDVGVWNEPDGRPRLRVPGGDRLAVSIAHRAGVAVAAVGEAGGVGARAGAGSTDPGSGDTGDAGGARVGIDVELVEPRSPTFVGLALRDHERRLGEGRPADAWVTAVWAAKEAVAKAAGTGLRGRPKDWVVQAADGDWMLVAGTWVRTAREREHVVAVVAPRSPAVG